MRSARPGFAVPRIPSGPWQAKQPFASASRRPRSAGVRWGRNSDAAAISPAMPATAAAIRITRSVVGYDLEVVAAGMASADRTSIVFTPFLAWIGPFTLTLFPTSSFTLL